MSHIDYTKKSKEHAYETTVCLTREESKALLPFFRNARKEVKKKYDKYDDIHESGEATERQENLRARYEEELESLDSILENIETVLKQ